MALLMQPLSITLRGITNAAADPSVDIWRTVTLPLLRQATGLSDGFELKVVKRGAEPLVRLLDHKSLIAGIRCRILGVQLVILHSHMTNNNIWDISFPNKDDGSLPACLAVHRQS